MSAAARREDEGRYRFDWSYLEASSEVRALEQRALHGQWLIESLAWETPVDPALAWMPEPLFPLAGSDLARRLGPARIEPLRADLCCHIVSQLLHGEQGALLAASDLVARMPDLGSKLFAATQVVDEARHVQVFDRYLRDKVGRRDPISPELEEVLRRIDRAPGWELKVLGTQVILEGLALATLGTLQHVSGEPLLRQIAQYVLRDEGRHVSFSVQVLAEAAHRATPAETEEREQFVFELVALLHERQLFGALWTRADLPLAECLAITAASPAQQGYRRILFSRILGTLDRVGLLSARLLARFAEIGVATRRRGDVRP